MWYTGAVLVLLLGAAANDAPPKAADKKEPSYLDEFQKIKKEMDKLQESLNKEFTAAKTEKERDALIGKATRLMKEKGEPLADKAVALVRPHAADKEAVEVLAWVLNYEPASPAANTAADLLAKYHLKDPRTLDTVSRFTHAPMPWTDKLLRTLADADLPRGQKVRALLGLAESTKSRMELPGMLQGLDQATLQIVEERYGKKYLDELRAADPAKLEKEAVRLYKEAAQKYGSEKYGDATVAEVVERTLFELENLRIGKKAPDIEGEDIDGKKFKLSDYKGKVIVLDFWGNW